VRRGLDQRPRRRAVQLTVLDDHLARPQDAQHRVAQRAARFERAQHHLLVEVAQRHLAQPAQHDLQHVRVRQVVLHHEPQVVGLEPILQSLLLLRLLLLR
jgi:hypothetical protein